MSSVLDAVRSPGMCTSCKKEFPYIIKPTCDTCEALAAGKDVDGLQCLKCGRVLKNLVDASCCGHCKIYEATLGPLAKNAVNNPPNPQDNHPYLQQYASPTPPTQNQVDRGNSKLQRLALTHSSALRSSGADPQLIQKSKVSASVTAGLPLRHKHGRLQTWIDGFTLNIDKKAHPLPMGRINLAIEMERPWSEAVTFFKVALRQEVQNRIGILVEDSQMQIGSCQVGTSKRGTKFLDVWTEHDVGTLWTAITEPPQADLYVSKQEAAKGSLRCYGFVTLTDSQEQEYNQARRDAHKQAAPSVKRQGSIDLDTEGEPCSNRPRVSSFAIPLRQYQTQVVHDSSAKGTRTFCTMGNDACPVLTTSPEIVTVQLGSEVQASGGTKNMYRLSIGHDVFAAKSFKFIGSSKTPVSAAENLAHLEQELCRHTIAADIAQLFKRTASMNKVQIYDFLFTSTFIFTITMGPQVGWAYLVDPMLPNRTVTKFSGTAVAGYNQESLMGRTIDAFAHFSLSMSGEQLVLVDLQGIQSDVIVNGIRDINNLTLFDTMSHTADCTSGLGDKGAAGIQEFKQQHVCNVICHGLGLSFADAPVSPDLPAPTPAIPPVPYRRSRRLQEAANVPTSPKTIAVKITSAHLDEEGSIVEITDPYKSGDLTLSASTDSFNQNKYKLMLGILSLSDSHGEQEYILVTPNEQALPTTAIFTHSVGMELERFFVLSGTFSEFSQVARNAGIQIADIFWDFEMVRGPNHEQQWLGAKQSTKDPIVEHNTRSETSSTLIDYTLHAFSHYVCAATTRLLVHTDFFYMHNSTSSAFVIGVTTHGNSSDYRGYPYSRPTGIQEFIEKHQCGALCTSLGLAPLKT